MPGVCYVTLLTNTLTFNFSRAVTWLNDQQVPQLMEVCVIPLANPSFPDQGTYVGGLQSQTVLLNDSINRVQFNLVPSYAAGLSEPVLYRAEWRQGGISGQTYSQDFSMPAENVSWDQLESLGSYVTGVNYVQQSQVGVAQGVAALNAGGHVVDASGTPVAVASDIAAVTALVTAETANRTSAVNALQVTLSNSLSQSVANLSSSTASALTGAVTTLNNSLQNTYTELNASITAEASFRSSEVGSLVSQISGLNTQISTINTSLAGKASLVGGYLSLSQVPPALLLVAYPVSGQAGMLSLSSTAMNGNLPPVHYADIALWADGTTWMLLGNPSSPSTNPDPSVLSNWVNLTVTSTVNGKKGQVTLVPADIGAVGVNGSYGSITQSQVTGLSTTLALYTPLGSFNSLSATVTSILNNTNIVYLDTSGSSQGYINHSKLDSGVAYVNTLNQVCLKDGTVIAAGTGTVSSVNGKSTSAVTLTASDVGAMALGVAIAESQVTGLVSDLASRVLTTDSRLSDARTPTSHKSIHQLGGTDALALDWTQVSDTSTGSLTSNQNLKTIVASLTPLTTSTIYANQINALQTSVAALSGGATGTGNPIKSLWFDGPTVYTGVTNPDSFAASGVQQKSPFGRDSTTGQYYYNPAGASAGEWVYPYITPNGHLQLRTWNPSAPADTVYATQDSVTALQNQASTLATQASLAVLQTQVNGLATQSSVTALGATVSTLATQSSVNALATQVGNAASQAQLNATNATVATLATQSSVNSLASSISNLATQSSVNALSGTVASTSAALSTKADLVNGLVPLNELPQNIPASYVSGLVTALSSVPTLTGGLLSTSVIPALPISQITNLQSTINGLCPLVGGLIPSQYLPSLSINNVFVVANSAALTTQSTAHVGDIGVVTGGSSQGTYILSSSATGSYSTLSNWILLPSNQSVTSVNGQIGAVSLTASSVNAIPVGGSVSIGQVTGLSSWLPTGTATTLATAAQLTGLQSLSQVQSLMSTSQAVRQQVSAVATTAVSSLSSLPTIDGVQMNSGNVVLLTAQSSSVNNGLWTVASGSWTRPPDFASGSYLARDTIVFVGGGQTQANTIWQETSASGVVDTAVNNWSKIGSVAAPISYTAGNGTALTGNAFSVVADPRSGAGISVSSQGVAVDTSVVARKASGYVPAGSTIATVTHTLNTTDVIVWVKEVSTGNQVLACATVTGPNTVTIEFGSPPATNQYRWTVIG